MLNSRLFRTISFQLTALHSVIFALCFLALLVVTYLTTTAALRAEMQNEIGLQLEAMAEEAKSDGIASIVQDINEAGNASGYYFLSDKDGKKLAGNLAVVAPQNGWRENGVGIPGTLSSQAEADDDHRIWGQGMRLPDGSFLFVGGDAFRVLTTQEAIITTFAWSGGLALLLAALAGLAVSRGFLRRIDDINATSLAILDGHLKKRIPVRGTSDEIDRLSINLNQLFDSNQSLLESLKQVSSSIAHDLRTPLSHLRQGLEEARTSSLTKRDFQRAVDNAIVKSDQLLGIFAALLRIAQIESGSRKAGFKQFELTTIVERVADAYRAVAEEQGKALETRLAEGVRFVGDRELVTQMLANLVENAIRHTPAGTAIGVGLEADDKGIAVTVTDTGPGIPEDQRGRVLEHFYRLDASRSTSGSGLGLALVAAIAKLHSINLELIDNQPGLKVALRFPPAAKPLFAPPK